MSRAYTPPPPPPPHPTLQSGSGYITVRYCVAHAESRGCITVYSQQDGRIVGHVLSGKDTARLPDELYNYDDDQKAKDWLFIVFIYIFRGKTNHLEKLIAIFLSTSYVGKTVNFFSF